MKKFARQIKTGYCFKKQWPIILVFLVRLSACVIILKMLKGFSKNKIDFLWHFTCFYAVYQVFVAI
jgi:hypothetical protein